MGSRTAQKVLRKLEDAASALPPLLLFGGILMAGVGALVTRLIDGTGPCAPDALGTFLELGAGVGAFAALALFVVSAQKGRARLLWPAAALVGCITWCFGGGVALNQWLDGGPATVYEHLPVQDKETFDGIESTSYLVILQAPPERACEGTWRVGASARSFQAIQPGSTTATVVVKPGFFGFPWVKSAALVSPRETPSPKGREP